MPALPNSPNPEPRVLEIQVPASALQENKLHSALTATPIIQSIMTLPPAVAASVLQQHINAVLANSGTPISKQLDGTADTSDDDGSDVSDDNLDNDDDDDNLQVKIDNEISRFEPRKYWTIPNNCLYALLCRKMKKKRRALVPKRSLYVVMMTFLTKKTKMTYLIQRMWWCVNMIKYVFNFLVSLTLKI